MKMLLNFMRIVIELGYHSDLLVFVSVMKRFKIMKKEEKHASIAFI